MRSVLAVLKMFTRLPTKSWAVLGLGVLIVAAIAVLVVQTVREPHAATVSPVATVTGRIPFAEMTPAQHLAAARTLLQVSPTQLSEENQDEAAQHIRAVPEGTAESKQAESLMQETIKNTKKALIARLADKGLARRRYASNLEVELTREGFDSVVTVSVDKLVLASNLFNDESNRVHLLGRVRSGDNARGLCELGFRKVVLTGLGLLSETHTYSLECGGRPL